MKVRISPLRCYYLNSVNRRGNRLNPFSFLFKILKCLVFSCLLLAESNGKIERSSRAFQSQIRNSLLREEVLYTEGVWQTSLVPHQ